VSLPHTGQILFTTPSRAILRADRLELPPHAGVLIRPAS
jgi:hypothetical protein